MARHPGQRWPRVRGNVDRARPSQAWALSGLSSPDAGAGSPSRTPRVPCVRPWTALAPLLPHSAISTPEPQHPPPRAPRCPTPASLLSSLSLYFTTCGCGWFPGAVTLLCRTLPAAGRPCDMPGAPPVQPPRRAASRRSGRAAGRALDAGRCLLELSSHRHPRAHTCRPPAPRPAPKGFPLSKRVLPRRLFPASPPPVPARRPSRPQVCPAPSFSQPASFPPLAAPRGPKSHPCRSFPLGPPALRGSHVVAPKP